MKYSMLFSKLAMLLFAVTPLFVTTSCGKETPAPVVTLTEVGHENSHTATIGDEMHLEADIMADGLIKVIYVELHQEDGGYEIETSYTAGKYIGVRNTRFHEHIDIPTEAPAGEYHLHFSVTDQKSQQTSETARVHFGVE